jgi:hypothetical protein
MALLFDYRLHIMFSLTHRVIVTALQHTSLVRNGGHLVGTLCPLKVVDGTSRLCTIGKIRWGCARRDSVSLLRTTVNLF